MPLHRSAGPQNLLVFLKTLQFKAQRWGMKEWNWRQGESYAKKIYFLMFFPTQKSNKYINSPVNYEKRTLYINTVLSYQYTYFHSIVTDWSFVCICHLRNW